MTSKPKSSDAVLSRLVDVLRDEVFAKSDAEILSDGEARFGDVDKHVMTLKAEVAARVAGKRKAKLKAAQAGFREVQSKYAEGATGRSLEHFKELARLLFEQRTDLPEGLTLAFRSGESLSEQDWATLIDDLVELGFLSDE
jgi:hypothetical protein